MRWLLKRWQFWGGMGFMLVALCAGYLLIPVERDRITQENCDKIQDGWSPEQVLSLLGKPSIPTTLPKDTKDGAVWIFTSMMWRDEDDNEIWVFFQMEVGIDPMHVDGKEFRPSNFSIFERVKRRVKRRLQALWP
jgi:hypothetical protein